MKYAELRKLIDAAKVREVDPLHQALIRLDALPIPWAWVGCFGIRADGEVVYVDDDGNSDSVNDDFDGPDWRIATLIYAAERNPELAFLLPSRPPRATSCEGCDGSGRVTIARGLCGDCNGLGWI